MSQIYILCSENSNRDIYEKLILLITLQLNLIAVDRILCCLGHILAILVVIFNMQMYKTCVSKHNSAILAATLNMQMNQIEITS